MKANLVAAAAVALCAVSAPAFAEDQVTRTQDGFAVHYGDLNLSTSAGQQELLERVDHAINRTCFVRENRSLRQVAVCQEEMREQVMQSVNREVRVALERAERGRA